MNYAPKEGDIVIFDIKRDFRKNETLAVNVRCKQLYPLNREMGTIMVLKEDFGFIKYDICDVVSSCAWPHISICS